MIRRAVIYLSSGDAELSAIDVRNARQPRTLWHLGEHRNKSGTWGVSADESTIYLGYIRTFVPFQGRWSGIKALDRQLLDKQGSVRH